LQTPSLLIESDTTRCNERNFFFCDSTVFQLFDFQFIDKIKSNPLTQKNTIVITKSTAIRYFGTTKVLGKSLMLESSVSLEITGIINDIPKQSHYKIDFLASFPTINEFFGSIPKNWVWNPCWTYVLLKPNISAESVNEQLKSIVNQYYSKSERSQICLYLQPLTDIRLRSKLDYEMETNSNIWFLYILISIAISVLIIASINFMNLATASSSVRAKEVAVKKVVGASRKQLIIQFVGETIILSVFSLFVALALVEILMPLFNWFTEKNIVFREILTLEIFCGFLLFGMVLGIISGLYPAFYLSSFMPQRLLKGTQKRGKSGLWARKILVVSQYIISIVMIIATYSNFRQLNFMLNADLGFNKENILIIPNSNNPLGSNFDDFSKVLQEHPDIQSVTGVSDIIGISHNTRKFFPEGFPFSKIQFYPDILVQYNFTKTFGIKLLAGRDFCDTIANDNINSVLINEAMVKHLGCKSNMEALGKVFHSINGNEKIIGVINNFHVASLRNPLSPFVVHIATKDDERAWFTKYIAIKLKSKNSENALTHIQKTWLQYTDNHPLEYTLLNNELALLYKDENIMGNLSLLFTMLAIFIANMGILGLTSFLTAQRIKEIGIRKVLGATVFGIVRLFAVEFLQLISIALVVALPIGYLIITLWFKNFAYHINIDIWGFLLAASLSMILALSIILFHSYRAAKANPMTAIRHE